MKDVMLIFIFEIHINTMRLISLLLLLISLTVNAQNNTAFQGGERLNYNMSYNMSGILNDFARVTMETSDVKTKKSTLLRLKCTAATFSKWDSYFKIRDLYESYVNPTSIAPYLYKREIDEGGHYKFVKYNFKYKSKTVQSLIRKKSKNFESGFWDTNKDLKMTSGTRDIVATLYKLRTLDIHKAPVGTSDSFTVLFDNKEIKLSFKLLGKETINTAIGKKECYKLAIGLSETGLLKGKNANLIWLTADENKIPVYAKFKAAVGSGELKIQSASGLKN